jgi:hypothetical protein
MPKPLDTPILFCNFNRPILTKQVFASIRNQRPKTLFLSCDGPRADHPDDVANVMAVREILKAVDWACDVHTRFPEENLGCKHAISSAIDWAFEQTEALIILEDDCLPSASFYGYCHNLLDRFRNEDRVMMISGNNFQPRPTSSNSYYFSRWTHIWGWATWKRAWSTFDVDVSSWPQVRQSQQLMTLLSDPIEYAHWTQTFEAQHAGHIDTWDFPWMYAVWANNGLSILPERNLVSNIGFGEEATHTRDPESVLAGLPVHELGKIIHPERVEVDSLADRHTWETIFLPHVNVEPSAPVRRPRGLRRLYNRLFGAEK